MVDLFDPVLGAAVQHVAAVVEEGAQHLLQRADLGHAAVDQHVHVQREADFEVGDCETARAISISGSTVRARGSRTMRTSSVDSSRTSARSGIFFSWISSASFSIRRDFWHLIGDFGDDDLPRAAAEVFDMPVGAGAEGAAAGAVGLKDDRARFHDDAAGGEIGAGDQVDQRLVRQVGVGHQGVAALDQLIKIVRRDVGGHADGDAGGAVGQKVREGGGHDDRFFQRAVVVRAEVDGVFGQAFHQGLGDRGQARFGIAGGGRVIAVDVAEVALPVDQRVADVEILREPRHRVIDRGIAVRVVVAHHVADDLGRFAEGRRWRTAAVRASRKGCGGGPASARRGRRAARGA